MKAIKPAGKIASDNKSFLKNRYSLDVNEIYKNLSEYILDSLIS